MPIQQSKRSKSRYNTRRNMTLAYDGEQANVCTTCGAPVLPHRACKKCGTYRGQQVIQTKEKAE